MVWHRSRARARCEVVNPWQERDAVSSSARKDQCTERSLEKVKLSTPLSFARNYRRWMLERIVRISHTRSWRTSRWSGYPIHPIPRTFIRTISMHFEAWKTHAAGGTSRTARTWSSNYEPGLQPGLKTSGGEVSNNCQNDGEQKVQRRSQECLSCWYLP